MCREGDNTLPMHCTYVIVEYRVCLEVIGGRGHREVNEWVHAVGV